MSSESYHQLNDESPVKVITDEPCSKPPVLSGEEHERREDTGKATLKIKK